MPKILENKNLFFFFLFLLVVELSVLALPFLPSTTLPKAYTASVLPAVLDNLTNNNRQSEHLAALTDNPLLDKAAELKARDMAEKGYFSHVSPDGKTPWYWFDLVGYNYKTAGENLAVDFNESQDVVVAWMNSPSHRANIVGSTYTEIGTGVATGTYEGSPAIFVAQVYGRQDNSQTSAKLSSVNKNFVASVGELTGLDWLLSQNKLWLILGLLVLLMVLYIIYKVITRTIKISLSILTLALIILVIVLGIYLVRNYLQNTSRQPAQVSFVSFQNNQFIK